MTPKLYYQRPPLTNRDGKNQPARYFAVGSMSACSTPGFAHFFKLTLKASGKQLLVHRNGIFFRDPAGRERYSPAFVSDSHSPLGESQRLQSLQDS